jgi:hypothetical protein
VQGAFFKNLAKVFRFFAKNGNPAQIGVIFLYNPQGFYEISMVFNVVQAWLAFFWPRTGKLSQDVASKLSLM